ncbi:unnamed protein product [Linum tenue]|uniref:Uncharacterized protein n=1 Tax=Linum tenue TaxID=586396 RepID=A0AAV0RU77_9ROSI|nr:unnamed protein product [Linum tenue]
MGLEQNDKASFPPAEPKIQLLFFGLASNISHWSKWYTKIQVSEEQAVSAKAASKRPISEAESIVAAIKSAAPVAEHVITVEKSLAAAMGSSLLDAAAAKVVKAANRRVCLTRFKSRCGSSFCDSHRYPERTTIATTISRKLGRIQLLKQIRSSRIKWNYGFSVVTYLVLLLNRFYSFSYKLF